jgi:hypothetical protein
MAPYVQFSLFIETASRGLGTERTPMPKLSVVGLVVLLPLAGCAAAPKAAAVPSPQIAAVVEAPPSQTTGAEVPVAAADAPMLGQRVRHHVEITIDHLPKLKSFGASTAAYVVWVRGSEEEAWANAASLVPSDEAQIAELGYPEDMLFVRVTAETTAAARTPSARVLLSTRVSRNGACASGVDENEITMRVRMCRDEK